MTTTMARVLAVSAAAVLGASARAQLSMDWFTLDGGGGESLGATLELLSTVGQADAGPTLAGPALSWEGGFWPAMAAGCPADFNGDGFIDFFDYDDFVACYETMACPAGRTADITEDGFVDFFDYDAFVGEYEKGC